VRAFRLACLAYFTVALPSSTLGLLWPSMRLSFHQPVATLSILLVVGITASVLASTTIGYLLARLSAGAVLALGTGLTGVALAVESLTPWLWLFALGMVFFGFGSGAIDAAVNAHAAHHFGARQINWMHAGYGIGATLGPVLATALLGNALTWRWVYGIMAVLQAVVALVCTAIRRGWVAPPPAPVVPPRGPSRRRPSTVLSCLAFTAVESGIESAVGVWGYVFLTDGRGLTPTAAGVVVSAYWAMMFLGRVVLGVVADHVGSSRVLGAAVAGVPLGCVVMAVPGPGVLAVLGLLVVGVATAPIFPLFTLTTAQRVGATDDRDTTRTVGWQVAASAIGSAVLPAGGGLVIGSATAFVVALLLLGLAMCVLYRRVSTRTG
jgi:MFS family permease